MSKNNKSSKRKGKGWFGDRYSHKLASMGIPTKNLSENQAKELYANGKWSGKPTKEDQQKMKTPPKDNSDGWWDSFKTSVGKVAKKGKDVAKKGKKTAKKGKEIGGSIKDFLTKEEDNYMGNVISDDIQKTMSQNIAQHKGEETDRESPDYSKEDLKQLKESGTPAELVKAIRKGDVVDADAIEISDENAQELSQHLGDLKHDAEMAEEMGDRMDETHDEMKRYYKNQYEKYHDELKDEWDNVESTLTDNEREKELNEYKHKDEMKKIEMKNKISEHKANVEYAEDVAKALDKIYENRKELVKRLIE